MRWYRNDKDSSIDRHVKHRALELGANLKGKIKVYLDLRFWLILRDVVLDRAERALLVLKMSDGPISSFKLIF